MSFSHIKSYFGVQAHFDYKSHFSRELERNHKNYQITVAPERSEDTKLGGGGEGHCL